jgi:outer membrane protein assembly factor BamB
MKSIKNTAIAFLLLFAITASLFVSPSIYAQGITEFLTNIYVAPQPLTGVGQAMSIVYFTDQMVMPCDLDSTLGATSGRETWLGITLTITTPNGTIETIKAGPTDPVGAGYVVYVPIEIGKYTVQAHFPATWKNRTTTIIYGASNYRTLPAGSYYFPAADSKNATFIVQQEQVQQWTNPPLPEDYWTRPIGGPSNTWSILAGNWLEGAANVWPQGGAGGVVSNYGYGTAPESAHILWTRQYTSTGSIVDERFGSQVNYYGGYQAVSYSAGPILDGKIHVSKPYTIHDSSGGYEIWDLYTGEQLFYDPNGTKPAFGQIYLYDSPNQHGCALYLWKTSGVTLPQIVQIPRAVLDKAGDPPRALGPVQTVNLTATSVRMGTVYEMLDASTGNHVCYIANVSGGTAVYGKDGSILRYNTVNLGSTANPKYYLQVWNSSAGTMVATQSGTGYWQWRPAGGFSGGAGETQPYLGGVARNYVHDGNTFYSLNVSIPSLLGPNNALLNQTATIQAVREGKYIIVGATGRNDERGVVSGWLMCLSLEHGKEGQKLWETTFTPPFSSTKWYNAVGFNGVFPDQEVFIFGSETELKAAIVYDMKTGQKLWETNSTAEPQLGYYGFQTTVYDDMIITGGAHSGILTAYNAKTGEVRWQYTATGEGTDTPYGNDLARGFTVSDGKLYTSISEHSESSPLWRSPGLKCLNITTGEELWKILFWGRSIKIADGILTAWNYYDGQVYAFGKGPSATTVSASPEVSAIGNSVMIKGTVTDQTSTGRRNVNNVLEFSLKDTPAISDEDMQAWMQYKFMGQGYPAGAKGVELVLSVLDPNNNMYEIGKTTSDSTGAFSSQFDPEVPGTYYITARFKGSASYYPSFATISIQVSEEATAIASPYPAVVLPPTEMYIVGGVIAIIVAIAIVGIVIVTMLKKRP